MAAGCQGFLLQLELYLAAVQPAPMGPERVSALISRLTGKALEWANAIWGREGLTLDNYEDFTRRFRAVFDHPPEGRAVGGRRENACIISDRGRGAHKNSLWTFELWPPVWDGMSGP